MAEAALRRFVHPKAQALAGLEWGRLLRSPLAEVAQRQLAQSGMLPFMESAERVLISSPGRTTSGAPPPFVAAIEGLALRNHLRALALGSEHYRSAELLITPSWIVGVVDTRTVLVGDMESVKAAIDGASQPAALCHRAARLGDTCDAWLLTAASPAAFLNPGLDWVAALSAVQRLEAAIAFRAGLEFELRLQMPTSEAAASAACNLAGLITLATLEQSGESMASVLLQRLNVWAAGDLVRAELFLERPDFERVAASLSYRSVPAAFYGRDGVVRCRRVDTPEPALL